MSLLYHTTDPTQAEEIYCKLKSSLMVGEFLPGSKLSIRSLSQETGAGASPVREALKRLASERVLEGGVKKSYIVPTLSDKRAVDLFNLRTLLECEAAALALPKFGPKLLPRLRDITERMDEALVSRNLEEYISENKKFHFLIYDQCGNADMLSIIEQLWMQTGPSLKRGMFLADYDVSWNRQHLAIVGALETRDLITIRREILRDIGWGAEHYTQQIA